MVAQDWSDLRPEQRVARLFADKHLATIPPVPIEALLSELAEIEYCDLPGSCDALLVRRSAHAKPRVFVARSASPNRVRFSLAHELGHIVLPWQAGSVFCHTDVVMQETEGDYLLMESEANRFAAALMLPQAWVVAHWHSANWRPANFVTKVAQTARVSVAAAALACQRTFPPGCLIVLTDPDNSVEFAFSSPRSVCAVPQKGDLFRADQWKAVAEITSIQANSYSTVHSVEFPRVLEVADPQALDARTSSEILNQILEAVLGDPEQVARTRQSIQGRVGYIKNELSSGLTSAEYHAALRQSFLAANRHSDITRHPDFERFLAKKAIEMSTKLQRRRP